MDTVTNSGTIATTNPAFTTTTGSPSGLVYTLPATASATPAPTVEELQKKLQEAEQRAANKADEAARHYKKVEAFEKAEADRKAAEMTETEKLNAKLAEAEAKRIEAEKTLQDEREKSTILSEANKPQFGEKKLKFAEPELLPMLLTPEMKAEGILKALQELAKAHPSLLETAAQPGGDGVGSPRKGQRVDPAAVEQNALDKKRREYGVF